MLVSIMKKSNKDGYVAIETVVSVTVFLFIFMTILGLFLAIYPRVVILQESNSIAQLASVQGGLTDEDVKDFTARISSYGFVDNSDSVEINLITEAGVKADNIDPVEIDNGFYVKRADLDAMMLVVRVPLKLELLNTAMSFFGDSSGHSLGLHQVEKLIYSERY